MKDQREKEIQVEQADQNNENTNDMNIVIKEFDIKNANLLEVPKQKKKKANKNKLK